MSKFTYYNVQIEQIILKTLAKSVIVCMMEIKVSTIREQISKSLEVDQKSFYSIVDTLSNSCYITY
ncbi:hypothetical protein CFPU101_15290 [Chroococcus sp. FPU101]|nr:hypothetical protein CFPU101_15290 [Chroococcus sp. FPU101]